MERSSKLHLEKNLRTSQSELHSIQWDRDAQDIMDPTLQQRQIHDSSKVMKKQGPAGGCRWRYGESLVERVSGRADV